MHVLLSYLYRFSGLFVCLFVWSGKFGSLFSLYENLTAHFKHRDLNVMTFRASLEFSLTSWNTVEFSRDFYWVKALGVFLAFHSRIHMAMFILDGCESLLEVNSRHFSWTQHNVNPVGNIVQRRRVLASKRILIKRVPLGFKLAVLGERRKGAPLLSLCVLQSCILRLLSWSTKDKWIFRTVLICRSKALQ